MKGKKIQFESKLFTDGQKRNVVDHYKWLTDAEIKANVDRQKNNFSLLLVNIDYDNNTGNLIRSANVFGAKEIILYGRKKFDRRSSVGTEFYMDFRQIAFKDEFEELCAEFDYVVGLEQVDNSINLAQFQWDYTKNYLICLGHEGQGLPQNIIYKCNFCLEIPQLGSVRSLNVGTSGGIIMYDYNCKKV